MKKNKYHKWNHPYKPDPKYKTRVAYFCMEYGIHQPLKIYSGGLGFLAGSHMRSAYDLKQNLIGVGILWKYGYYDQMRAEDASMKPSYQEKHYSFLEDSGIMVDVEINGFRVFVKAMVLPPELFGNAPLYLLTTDVPQNDHLSQTITEKLYDSNEATRVAQSIVLGIGGAKVVEALGGADIYHMNEGHALPLAYHLYSQLQDLNAVRDKVVFTTHTPVKAGNDERHFDLLHKMGFFSGLPKEFVRELTPLEDNGLLGYTPAALRMSKKANGVSQLHGHVAKDMWKDYEGICEIIGITNSQNQKYWADTLLNEAYSKNDIEGMKERKKQLKENLFELVADQTGKLFDPEVLTIVWARRFASYKRADLIMRDTKRFERLINDTRYPVQIIWAGKPYPEDGFGLSIFKKVREYIRYKKNCAILTGYELSLSGKLKKGSDVWLNTPRRPKEASGTSGMTAAMNGSVSVSINDGWIPEFARDKINSFVLPEADLSMSEEHQDEFDYNNLMDTINEEVLPIYYDSPEKWWQIVRQSMTDIYPAFDSDRMADEYYTRLYDVKVKHNDQQVIEMV